MKLYVVKELEGFLPATLFQAMAQLGQECLIITEPKDTFLSLGYFDNLKYLIDIHECQKLKVPIMRRITGGGAVLLSKGQVFYQLVIDRHKAPFKVEEAYRKFSKPVIEVYRRLGLEVYYRPINDLVTKEGRKISGQGACDVGRMFVFVGNVLVNFDTHLMARLFRLPKEFVSFVEEALRENLTWLERELNRMVSFEEVASLLVEEFSKMLDLEGPYLLPEEALNLAQSIAQEQSSPECLFEDTGRKHELIKLREGVYLKLVDSGLLLIEDGLVKRSLSFEE
ncbi:lipoate--protein ligase family protein [Thermocrinis minervae]|uniref:Lipoate-protein ligase A n=1 Tax=Thermocrinis minervae TaxID=381751 RepID=A0A1M6S2J4_9AQUI|nr:biotin/lipoate A/B protein ligase family protein [Thermocrinis minervae]SHK39044.1 lipoate-protein ligase A [Thermocrinis minervae]